MSRNITLIILSVSIFSVIVTFLLFLLSFSLIFDFSSENDSISETSKYQYQDIDLSMLSSNTISNGFVTMNKKLCEDEFLSYQNEETGSSIIISHFADSRYECTGSCTCSSTNRRSSTLLTRSLYLLFSAATASLAFKIAEPTFHDQCLLRFSSTCDEENISSEVQSCSEKEEEGGTEEEEEAEYSCEGHCLPKRMKNPSTIQRQQDFFEEEGKCEDLKTSGSVKVERKDGTTFQKDSKTGKVYAKRFRILNHQAKEKFFKFYMTPFCKEMSRRPYVYISPSGQSNKYVKANMCVSKGGVKRFTGGKSVSGRSAYENVKCVLISERAEVSGAVREARKKNQLKAREKRWKETLRRLFGKKDDK